MAKKITPEPPPPRTDGLIATRKQWRDLGVGMTVEMNGRKWTITDSAIPQQFAYGRSLWFKFVAPRGEEYNCPPQVLVRPVWVLSKPGETLPPPTRPANEGAVDLLVAELGAVEIATKDNASGEWWCPNYAAGVNHLDERGGGALFRGEIMHLQVTHGVDTSGLEAIEDTNASVIAIAKAHDDQHRSQGGRGFPHRHIPEDLSIM